MYPKLLYIYTMENDYIKQDDLSSLGELSEIDELIDNAAAATGRGDYQCALDGFERAMQVTQRIFGDTVELTELKHKINELHKLIDKNASPAE